MSNRIKVVAAAVAAAFFAEGIASVATFFYTHLT